jgi:hypothetical protein
MWSFNLNTSKANNQQKRNPEDSVPPIDSEKLQLYVKDKIEGKNPDTDMATLAA